MKLISVNVGQPKAVAWRGKMVTTGIFKSSVAGSVPLRQLNLDGDGQADLTVHGGIDKAVYLYPSEHYAYWQSELPDFEFTWGNFGENLTSAGLAEQEVQIGDQFQVGTALLAVIEPRMPCFKLGIRFGRADMTKRFLQSRRSGFYLAVLQEGIVAAGDEINRIKAATHGITVADVFRLYAFDKEDWETMRRAVEVPALSESWRAYFTQQLSNQGVR